MTTAGPLALVGGDEFKSGNEAHDERLARAAGDGPAFVVPTAAARQGPGAAVANARQWFARFGLELEELPVLRRTDAASAAIAEDAARGAFFYLVGGDPGLVVHLLRGRRSGPRSRARGDGARCSPDHRRARWHSARGP